MLVRARGLVPAARGIPSGLVAEDLVWFRRKFQTAIARHAERAITTRRIKADAAITMSARAIVHGDLLCRFAGARSYAGLVFCILR
jgi:hypothetical protein